jgi:hypothetical protein
MGLVLGQDGLQMPMAEDEHLVGDFRPGGEHEPFRIGVRARAARRDLHGLDAGSGQDRVERRGELPGPVPHQEPETGGAITQIHQQIADLLHGPRTVRVRSDTENVHVTGADLHDEQASPSTLLRWLNDGFVAGEQVTPGAPWRIRLTDQLRGMLTNDTPDGWVPLGYATQALGISRQTVLQKVKRGELRAVLTRTGRRKGLRIEVPAPQDGLF